MNRPSAVHFAEVSGADDSWIVQGRRCTGLPIEALFDPWDVENIFPQHLQGHDRADFGVLDAIDDAGRPFADAIDDAVSVADHIAGFDP